MTMLEVVAVVEEIHDRGVSVAKIEACFSCLVSWGDNKCEHIGQEVWTNITAMRYIFVEDGELKMSIDKPDHKKKPYRPLKVGDLLSMFVNKHGDRLFAKFFIPRGEMITQQRRLHKEKTDQLAKMLDSCERDEIQDTASGTVEVEWWKDDELVATGFFTSTGRVSRMSLYKDNRTYGHLEGEVALSHRNRGHLYELKYAEELSSVS